MPEPREQKGNVYRIPNFEPNREGAYDTFLASVPSENTRLAYRQALGDYGAWRCVSARTAALELIDSHPGQVQGLLVGYKASLMQRQLAAGTINMRICTLRSFLRHCRALCLTTACPEVRQLPVTPLRDTRGPSRQEMGAILDAIEHRRRHGGETRPARLARERAYVLLLYLLGLRRQEALTLDVKHFEPLEGVVHVLGKGQTDRIPMTVPALGVQALKSWLEYRAALVGNRGAIFCAIRHDAGRIGDRLTGREIGDWFVQLSNAVGFRVKPHGLRHASITRVLDINGGNLRSAQRFSRHANLCHLLRYDDNRQDVGGSMAALLADDLVKPPEDDPPAAAAPVPA